jgi:ribosomal-protein-alanine N-acetyltransferase
MTPADLDGVHRLEMENLSPWSREEIDLELGRHDRVQYVAVDAASGAVHGWCCCRFLGEQGELLKIAVQVGCRKRGIASALLSQALRYLADRGVRTLFLEVRSGNFPARQFYRKNGFVEIGMRRQYYSSPDDDALVLERHFGG